MRPQISQTDADSENFVCENLRNLRKKIAFHL